MKFIIFNTKGRVLYSSNTKLSVFNLMIDNIISGRNIVDNNNVISTSANNKSFKYFQYSKTKVCFAISYDSNLIIKNVNTFLLEIADLFDALLGEGRGVDRSSENFVKFERMFELKFAELEDLKEFEEPKEPESLAEITEIPTNSINSLSKSKKKEKAKGSKPAKKMRSWSADGSLDESENSVLDFSSSTESKDTSFNPQLVGDTGEYGSKKNNLFLINEMNEILDSKRESQTEKDESQSVLGGFIKGFLGGKTITEADIEKISQKLINHLIGKNIAPEISKNLIEKIGKQLVGTKTPSFTSIENFFRKSLIEELTKILTPNTSTDLLLDIKNNKSDRPYVISMVGVNGVGKSTNLAKLAYWFLQNDFKVLICACDTFRSGAVEQLRVHVKNLQRAVSNPDKIHLFEKGYGGGDHVVQTAKSALEFAKQQGFQIVLIDTAGRTHSNTKLMEPLKKFGEVANPDKIIMVGEALVGTDSVEQARNFNKAFGKNRGLNFFIISKVDTVGPLVGTMINMVVATNVPILFIGVGQTYTDIKKLSIPVVVDLLLS